MLLRHLSKKKLYLPILCIFTLQTLFISLNVFVNERLSISDVWEYPWKIMRDVPIDSRSWEFPAARNSERDDSEKKVSRSLFDVCYQSLDERSTRVAWFMRETWFLTSKAYSSIRLNYRYTNLKCRVKFVIIWLEAKWIFRKNLWPRRAREVKDWWLHLDGTRECLNIH